ncbi:MAG: DUF4129 domain-containing protein, partial [Acidimicrobiia bacterium]
LKDAGTVPALAATPIEFARRAPFGRPEVVTPMSRLAGLFTKVSYSPADASDDEAAAAWNDVDELARALDVGESRLCRWRRRLNPATLLSPSV